MTINNNSTTRVQISTGSSINITDLEIQESSQVTVTKTSAAGVESTLVIVTDYTVNSTLDTITLLVALATDELATATLEVENTQETSLTNFDEFNVDVIEAALDKITLKNKQQQETLNRTVKFNISTNETDITIPDPTGFEDMYLKLNSAGTAFEFFALSDGTGIGNIVEDTSPQLGGGLDTNGFDILVSAGKAVIFEGTTADAFETTLVGGEPTADRIITLPDATDTLVGKATADTLTNKTFNANGTGNSISNIEVADFASGVIDADLSSVSASDDTIPSAKGTKAYVDTVAALKLVGDVVQVVNTQTGAVATGTTLIPSDDTIPQNTEGDEYMTRAITPTNANNILVITVTTIVANSSALSTRTTALFQDSTANALACACHVAAANYPITTTFTHIMVAGTTSSTTFKVRAGAEAAGTTTLNGNAGARQFGGVLASSITITEIKV